MAYIQTIGPEDAQGLLKELYERDQASLGYIPNYTRVMSLRPDVNAAWRAFISAIRSHMDLRRYELVTLVAAARLRCTY